MREIRPSFRTRTFPCLLGIAWCIGIGVNAPFGLVTEYDSDWVGRFQGIKSDLKTININPTIAYKVNDAFSVGFGVNYQKFDAELTQIAVQHSDQLGTGVRAKLEADDDGFGWNAGVLFQAGPATRIGFSYRSAIDYTLEGDVTVH